jgi:hypothetical protein
MKTMKCIFMLGLMLLAIPATYAKEGPDQYPNGAENWLTGATPPPGFYFLNYAGYYTGYLKDANGNNALVGGEKVNVDATFDAFRFLEMTKVKIFGADWGMHVIVPIVYQSIYMAPLGGRASETNLGDITIDPFVLGWHHPQWHAAAGVDIDLPTGHYNSADPRTSIGAHYYSFEPLFCISYLPKSGWEASAKLMYNIKTTNPATNYHSGQEFHADYVAGKHIGSWTVGASGYVLKQVTDDTSTNPAVTIVAGDRGRVFAIGPSVTYTNKSHMTFVAQWQHETLVENRFGGDKIWFKAIIPISALSPHKKS